MDFLHVLIGTKIGDIEWWQMVIRSVIIFGVAVSLIRLGANRIFGRHTALDIVLSVILGSTLSRSLTANAPFWPVVASAVVLVVLHSVLAIVSVRSDKVAHTVKGRSIQLVIAGELLPDEMKEAGVSREDLLAAARLRAGTDSLEHVEHAYLERGGDISIITS